MTFTVMVVVGGLRERYDGREQHGSALSHWRAGENTRRNAPGERYGQHWRRHHTRLIQVDITIWGRRRSGRH